MISYLQIKIKGKWLWCFCAMLILAIVATRCSIQDFAVTQPDTAVVGSTVPIKVHFKLANITPPSAAVNFVFGFLVPKGWATSQNATITYTSTIGNGKMVLMPATILEPKSNGLTWPAALKKKFGIGGNLIDDMEWVVYQSDKAYLPGGGANVTADLMINIKVGADNNNTLCKLGYVIANANNGLTDVGSDTYLDGGQTYEYYAETITSCFQLTGGSGDLVDFCNPQLASYDPAKSLDNDFFTITYDGTVTTTALNGASAVYLCATANTSDGKSISVCEQTDKTKLTQTPAGSNRYKITIWPRSYFGLTDAQTIVNMTYYITDATGTIKVGYGNTASPFSYTFKCK